MLKIKYIQILKLILSVLLHIHCICFFYKNSYIFYKINNSLLAKTMRKNKNTTYKQKAYDYIYANIAKGKFKPGERLKAQEIADLIGISLAPTREAIMEMAASDLLDYQSNVGATVRRVSIQEVRQFLKLRMLVEPYAAGEAACHGSSEQFECVRKNLNDMYRVCESEAAANVKHDEEETRSILWSFAQADMKFHQAVLAAANNIVLSRFAKHLMDSFYLVPFAEMDLNVAVANLQESIDSHQIILKALQKRDPMAASQAMYDSLKAGERNVDKWEGIPKNLFMPTNVSIHR